MKNIHFLLLVCISAFFITSCSEDDVIYVDGNGQETSVDPSTNFAQSTYLEQTGSMSFGNNLLSIPLESKNIPTSVHRLDVVIFQGETQLFGGPWELYKDSAGFYRNDFDVDESVTPITGQNIKIDLYRMNTSNSTRDLIDTLYL